MKTPTDIIPRLESYFSGNTEVSAAYLFGSYAQGLQRPRSDVDVGVLFTSRNRTENNEKLEKINLTLARMLRKDIHSVALNHADERLLHQVFSKGRCIRVNDPRHHAWFKMISYSKIAEFGYYNSQFQKSFTRKLMQG